MVEWWDEDKVGTHKYQCWRRSWWTLCTDQFTRLPITAEGLPYQFTQLLRDQITHVVREEPRRTAFGKGSDIGLYG